MLVPVRSVHSLAAIGIVGFVGVRSVHYRVFSIPVRPGGHWGRSGPFGPLQCSMGGIGFVLVRSVHFRANWGL